MDGVYDVHTNVTQYPKIIQPTHARWERLSSPERKAATATLTRNISSLRLTNGAGEDKSNTTDIITPSGHDIDTTTKTSANVSASHPTETPTLFPAVPAVLSRRFAIHDVYFQSPPFSNLGCPGSDGEKHDVGGNGLLKSAAVATVADSFHPEFMRVEILADLPHECREALIETAAHEWEWKSRWRDEQEDGARVRPLKNYAWHP